METRTDDFTSFGLRPELLKGISDLGFAKPTPIQRDAIPAGLAGRDVLACAMTGSGKTAAFLLPILERLADRPAGKTRALVLVPTRELAAQVHEHFTALAAHTRLKGAAVFGGVAAGPQERAFRAGADVLIATPGRLLDHFQNPYARLDGLEVLVLDEADRMLDMGFLPDVRRVLAHLPKGLQTLFFSATLPPPIVALAGEMLEGPAAINIDRKSAPATGVTQAIYPVREDLKPWLLLALLRHGSIHNVLVFTRTKHRANRLADFLLRHQVACDRIHGNRSQPQRTQALANFKDGKIQVLVATDIAARGIDVEALSHVINFDVPNVPEDYIHRVGRTARAEAIGDAFTFASEQEQGDLAAIERAVGRRLPRLTVPGFDYNQKPDERLEIPIAERIAAIRARKAEDRARAREKVARKTQRETEEQARRGGAGAGPAARPQPPAQRVGGRPQGGPSGPQGGRPGGQPGGPRHSGRPGQQPGQPGSQRPGDRRSAQGGGRGPGGGQTGPGQQGPRHPRPAVRQQGPKLPTLSYTAPADPENEQPKQDLAPSGFNRRPAAWRRK
ncbi:MAG TPA: DEAD/DEAH box helicase [Thermoanaerobaculia bacterium]|nr:DEAD/DEAH box helicase [Thermoanaerobaculia bacterium]